MINKKAFTSLLYNVKFLILERIILENRSFIVGYHTQEFRRHALLTKPILCDLANAWLGFGYYFWTDIEFARYWGEDFKMRKTGYYDVYSTYIDSEKCINAVFNEEHYFFFRRCIEKAIDRFAETGEEITLKRVHEFLASNFWNKMGITGIIYDDLPFNPNSKPNRKYSVVEYRENNNTKFFYYKKRIQIVVFSLKNIRNFELFLKKQS